MGAPFMQRTQAKAPDGSGSAHVRRAGWVETLGGEDGSADWLRLSSMISKDTLPGEGHGLRAVANLELGVEVS